MPDQADSLVQRQLRDSLIVIAVLTLAAAWFSVTYFQYDEQGSVLDFMSLKLGVVPPQELPWEFQEQIRSWFQPFLYFLIARPLMLLGVRDMFDVAFVLRLLTGALSLTALAAFSKAILPTLRGRDERAFFAHSLRYYGYLPYLFVRTSSEAFSGAFFTLALALLINDPRSAPMRRWLLAGLLCGAAFESRYQSGFLVLGLVLWLAVVQRAAPLRIAGLLGTLACVVGLSLIIDHWGYGDWVFPPFNYVKVNLFEGVADQWGREPFFAFVYLLLPTPFLPLVLVVIGAMLVFWLRNPRHPVTWVTLSFVLAQSAVAHKEERFLFPLAIIATSYLVLAFGPSAPKFPFLARLWPLRHSWTAKMVVALTVVATGLVTFYPVGFRSHQSMAKFLYRNFPQGFAAYTFEHDQFLSYATYRHKPFSNTILHSKSELAALLARGPVLMLSATPILDPNLLPARARATLIYSELPFAKNAAMAELGSRTIARYRDIARHVTLPPLEWITLFHIDRPQPP